MKTLIVIAALALAACGDGGKVPIADGVRCGDADLANAPAGWCSNPDDIIHMGAPNSGGVVSPVADSTTK